MALPDDIFPGNERMSDDELLRSLKSRHSAQTDSNAEADPFEKDAVEGLQQLGNEENVRRHVQSLNTSLLQHLRKKKRRPRKADVPLQWVLLAVILLVFFCLMGYGLIHLLNH